MMELILGVLRIYTPSLSLSTRGKKKRLFFFSQELPWSCCIFSSSPSSSSSSIHFFGSPFRGCFHYGLAQASSAPILNEFSHLVTFFSPNLFFFLFTPCTLIFVVFAGCVAVAKRYRRPRIIVEFPPPSLVAIW